MVIVIAGMHRSGTSLVARLLNLCGVYLGEEKDLIPAAEDNTEGFWENIRFQNINEAILASFDGSWDYPPELKMGWETSSHLLQIRTRVDSLINEFSEYRDWGWKDPRNSLTLPYWKTHFPNLKVVVCFRNPYDVYRSLSRRAYSSNIFSYNLWLTYYQSLLAASDPENRIITHFESYFSNPHSELRRLINFLGLNVSDEVIENACKTISVDLKHNSAGISDLLETSASLELLKTYKLLSDQAGSVYRASLTTRELDSMLEIDAGRKATIEEYKHLSTILKLEIRDRDAQIRQLEELKLQKDEYITGLQSELREIFESRSWKLARRLADMKSFFFKKEA